MGANESQAVRAIIEAEAYDGPSLVLAYSHCIGQGVNMKKGLEQQKKAVQSGHWILARYNPALIKEGKNPLQLDSAAPSIPLEEYIYNENRYNSLRSLDPEIAAGLLKESQEDVLRRYKIYEHWAAMPGASE
jgi:pyruvate-ferredoxin/flavodoxin oxidoreductase